MGLGAWQVGLGGRAPGEVGVSQWRGSSPAGAFGCEAMELLPRAREDRQMDTSASPHSAGMHTPPPGSGEGNPRAGHPNVHCSCSSSDPSGLRKSQEVTHANSQE